MLETFLLAKLEEIAEQQNVCFKQDVATSHVERDSVDVLRTMCFIGILLRGMLNLLNFFFETTYSEKNFLNIAFTP